MLRELAPLLSEIRPVVIVEVLPAYSADNQARVKSQKDIEDLIRVHDYVLFRLEHDEFALLGFRQLEAFGIYSDIAMSDHLLVPQERVGDLQAAAVDRGYPFK